jgi:two-component system, chemotaxis family, sensor kinase CheA
VDLHSVYGHGTTVRIKIPLTLAIIPALIVTCGSDRYAIPQVSLVELVRVEGQEAVKAVERIHDAPVYRLRGTLLPLVYLDRVLGEGTDAWELAGQADKVLTIVVLQAEGRQFGLVVDAVREAEEIVVKPLGHLLKGITVFAGATTMGDGQVALILDVLGLAQRAHVIESNSDAAKAGPAVASQDRVLDRSSLLLFRVGSNSRMAVPVSEILRLEEFPRSRIEWSNNRELIQYRNSIMPLLRVGNLLQRGAGEEECDTLHVLVCSDNGRTIGLVVDQILDIVEDKIAVQMGNKMNGAADSAVIAGQVTDLLDVDAIVSASGIGSIDGVGEM